MSAKTFMQVSIVIFTIVSGFHLLRAILGFEFIVSGWAVPVYINVFGFLVAGYLAWQGFKVAK